MNSSGKRTFGANIRTLSDLTNSRSDDDNTTKIDQVPPSSNIIQNRSTSTTPQINITLHHIPTLPHAPNALSILHKIHFEFHPIIISRNWNVTSLSELCCCGTTRPMPNNVLGYNRTSFPQKTHAIHLRLRHVRSHALLDYASIAGTMCHELAHCLVGSHNGEFYRVMEEIEREYAVLLTDDARVLGGRSAEEVRRPAGMAAEGRRGSIGLSRRVHVLGEKPWRSPRDSARIAAERRLMDSQFCLPCNEVIEILEGGSSFNDHASATRGEIERGVASKGRGFLSAKVIDLTRDEGGRLDRDLLRPPLTAVLHSIDWTCAYCTLINKSTVMTCRACDAASGRGVPPSEELDFSAASCRNRSTEARIMDQRRHTGSTWATDWPCPRCTYENPSTTNICDACRLER